MVTRIAISALLAFIMTPIVIAFAAMPVAVVAGIAAAAGFPIAAPVTTAAAFAIAAAASYRVACEFEAMI